MFFLRLENLSPLEFKCQTGLFTLLVKGEDICLHVYPNSVAGILPLRLAIQLGELFWTTRYL